MGIQSEEVEKCKVRGIAGDEQVGVLEKSGTKKAQVSGCGQESMVWRGKCGRGGQVEAGIAGKVGVIRGWDIGEQHGWAISQECPDERWAVGTPDRVARREAGRPIRGTVAYSCVMRGTNSISGGGG